jgi:glycerol-3-phosphate acyltransferase PlsY
MNEITEETKRPTSITVICVIGFFGALLTVPLIFSPLAQQVGAWYPPYLGFSAVVGLACMIGLWMMKKWSAYTYTGLVALNQVVMLAMGVWNILALLIPAVVIFFALKNVPKMT